MPMFSTLHDYCFITIYDVVTKFESVDEMWSFTKVILCNLPGH